MARLLSWFLNAAYLATLIVLAPLIAWQSLRTGKYRAGYNQKLFGFVPRRTGDATCVWIHAVSLGEVNLLATILNELRTSHPHWQLVISTTSRAGYELARKTYADFTVFYCPLDFSWAVRTAMRRIRPTLLVLAELEVWPNLIAAAKQHGARVAIVNGRISDKSYPSYRRVRPLIARVLRKIDLVAAQNAESADRFRALGAPPERVHITGSLKYDGACTDRRNPRTLALRGLAGLTDDNIVFIAGSTQEPEEQYAIDIYCRLAPLHARLRLVLVPRHPERFDAVAALLDASNVPWQRRSSLDRQPPAPPGVSSSRNPHATNKAMPIQTTRNPSAKPASAAPILLVDTVGELAAWWGTATIAFVGGSFGPRNGQNMIEPAAYGVAVSFGPNTRNFRDITAALLAADGAVVVHDATELEAFVQRCLREPAFAASLGQRAQSLVESQLGATARTASLLEEILADRLKCRRREAA